jgi:hypothetical protein
MHPRNHTYDSPRNGLTLIELLVVLTILIALGGIVVASLPGLLERTRSATAAANVPEIDSAIRRRLITSNGDIGNRFDALITGGSGSAGEVARYVGGADRFEAISLSEAEIVALADVGLTELIPAIPAPADATFASHRQPPVALGDDTKVCVLSGSFASATMERIWNLTPPPKARYLVLGLGSKCSLVGGAESALFPEAPVHFSDQPGNGPDTMYSRYLIVIELQPVGQNAARARYVGVAIPGRQGLRGISEELQEAYSNQTAAR